MPAPAVAAKVAATVAKKAATDPVARRRIAIALAAAFVVFVAFPMTAIIVAIGGLRDPALNGPSPAALADIPADALAAYRDAGDSYDLDWALLAAIGKVECDHGRYQADGCNPPDTINSAGARGWMQFIGSTWRRGLDQHALEPRTSPPAADGDGYATDGDNDGDADPWSWPDATASAARYLTANGAQTDPRTAVWNYNHDDAYVDEVLALATTYRTAGASGDGTYSGTAGNVPLATVEGITVHVEIAPQVEALIHAARTVGFELTGGGYRSPDAQIALRRSHCGTSDYAIWEKPANQCSPPTARPGQSNHERGLAIDFSCNGTLIERRGTACDRWMLANAGAYGLRNLPSEPWHYSVDGN